MDEKITKISDSTVSPINFANSPNTGYMECMLCQSIVNIIIYKPGAEEPSGRALLLEPNNDGPLILIDICIYNEEDRRHGMAEDMMRFMCEIFPHIATGVISKGGERLCKKVGFVTQKKIFNKEPKILIWDNRSSSKEEE